MSEQELLGPTSHTFVSQRLKLHYVDWGNREAPPLLLLHGGRDHCRSWDWTAQALRKDWHVIALDHRGHGDSAWSPDGGYQITTYLYDVAQLIHQLELKPVSIVSHSMGSIVSLRYAGLYPENVRRLATIEGLGFPPDAYSNRWMIPVHQRLTDWIEDRRALAGKLHYRYPTLDAALARMRQENTKLSEEQARHLTIHAVSRNEDGSYSWKFDPYLRSGVPTDIAQADMHALWGSIACPVLLCWGTESWALDPTPELKHFNNARVAAFPGAGHWVHHDKFDAFLAEIKAFLK